MRANFEILWLASDKKMWTEKTCFAVVGVVLSIYVSVITLVNTTFIIFFNFFFF